jgi:hypothetical protein
VEWHNHRPVGIVPKFDVAPPLADLSESGLLQHSDDFSAETTGKAGLTPGLNGCDDRRFDPLGERFILEIQL